MCIIYFQGNSRRYFRVSLVLSSLLPLIFLLLFHRSMLSFFTPLETSNVRRDFYRSYTRCRGWCSKYNPFYFLLLHSVDSRLLFDDFLKRLVSTLLGFLRLDRQTRTVRSTVDFGTRYHQANWITLEHFTQEDICILVEIRNLISSCAMILE